MIVAGVDGGATRTRVVLVDETGVLLGSGTAGPSNFDNVGVEAASEAVRTAYTVAREAAGLPPETCRAAFLGVAGVVCEADREIVRSIARSARIAAEDRVSVDHDIRIALAGGLPGREGLVLIAGTGSSCYGRRFDGRFRHAGWGYLLDDLGSGYYLGQQAMVAAVHAADGRGEPTSLSDIVQKELGYDDIGEILHILYHREVSITRIASLAPRVLEAALANDTVARRIVSTGAGELSRMVSGVARVLNFTRDAVPVTMVGGLVDSSRYYKNEVIAAIRRRLPRAEILEPALPPVFGAALLALESEGVTASDRIVATMRSHTDRAA